MANTILPLNKFTCFRSNFLTRSWLIDTPFAAAFFRENFIVKLFIKKNVIKIIKITQSILPKETASEIAPKPPNPSVFEFEKRTINNGDRKINNKKKISIFKYRETLLQARSISIVYIISE
jgi:hypothetical protein